MWTWKGREGFLFANVCITISALFSKMVQKGEEVSKMSKKVSTWSMDDPYRVFILKFSAEFFMTV